MVLPCSKIVRAVDPNSTTLFVLFSLVFTEPEVFSSDVIPSHTASVSIDRIAICVPPSTTGSDPLARCKGGKQETSKDGLDRKHSRYLKKLSTNQPRSMSMYTLRMIYYGQAGDRMALPRTPTKPRVVVCGSTRRRRRNSDFSVDDHLLALERGVVLDNYELCC
jgi:hypothetical protein